MDKWIFVAVLRFFVAACGFSSVAHGLSCLTEYGILVLPPGIKPMSPALEGRFLITGTAEKSLIIFSYEIFPPFLISWYWPRC